MHTHVLRDVKVEVFLVIRLQCPRSTRFGNRYPPMSTSVGPVEPTMPQTCLLSKQLLPELEMESAKTHRLFGALPENQGIFQPHPKFMTLARLAGHTKDLYRIIALSLSAPDYDWAAWSPYTMTTKAELLSTLEKKHEAGVRSASRHTR